MKHLTLSQRFLALTVACLSLSLPVFSESKTLTLDDVLSMSVANNPAIQAVKAKIGLSDAEILSAVTSRPNPKVLSDNGFAEQTYRLGIGQTLELGGKRHERIKLAKVNRAILESEIQQELLLLRRNVRKAYVEYYLASHAEMLMNPVNQILKSMPEKSVSQGLIPDVIKIKRLENKLESLQTTKTIAQNNLVAYSNEKSLFNDIVLQAPEAPFLPDAPTSCLADESCLVKVGLERRPELAKVIAEIASAKQSEKLAKANRIPNLSITTGADLVTTFPRQFSAFIIGEFELPVYNRQQGAILEAKTNQAILQLGRQAQAAEIELDVKNALAQYRQAIKNRHFVIQHALPHAKTLYETAQNNFKAGNITLGDFLDQQSEYIEIVSESLEAEAGFQDAVAQLESSVGVSF